VTHRDEVESWLGLYYEFEWCLKACPHIIVLTDLIYQYKHELKKLKKRPITSLEICGPECVYAYDSSSSDDSAGYDVPIERMKNVYQTVPKMPYLREVVITYHVMYLNPFAGREIYVDNTYEYHGIASSPLLGTIRATQVPYIALGPPLHEESG
jgi:hypothetical protein